MRAFYKRSSICSIKYLVLFRHCINKNNHDLGIHLQEWKLRNLNPFISTAHYPHWVCLAMFCKTVKKMLESLVKVNNRKKKKKRREYVSSFRSSQ